MKDKILVLIRTLVAAAALFGVVACSNSSSQDAPKATTEEKSDEVALSNRAQARWDAILKGDYAGAYALETPAYRSVNDLVHFQLQFAGQVQRKAVRVEKVLLDADEPGVATVVMKLDFVTMVTNQPIESASYPRETWVKRDGQWWHLSKQ